MGAAAAIAGGVAVAGLGGAMISSNAATSAAKTQAKAAKNASQAQLAMFQQTKESLSPWVQAGQLAIPQVQELTGTGEGGNPLTAPLTSPFQPTIQQLEQTPGYQFILDQGLKGVQNSFAAKGLGTSGAAIKGAVNYAEGLAGTTFQQQFDNYWKQNQAIYGILTGISSQGQNAAAGVGNLGASAITASNNFLTSGAAATAAGQVGSANALNSGLASVGNAGLMYGMSQGMFAPQPVAPAINYSNATYGAEKAVLMP